MGLQYGGSYVSGAVLGGLAISPKSSGFGSTLVWITEEVGDEHRQALEWLVVLPNKWQKSTRATAGATLSPH